MIALQIFTIDAEKGDAVLSAATLILLLKIPQAVDMELIAAWQKEKMAESLSETQELWKKHLKRIGHWNYAVVLLYLKCYQPTISITNLQANPLKPHDIYCTLQLKGLGLLQAFEELANWTLLSYFCGDLNLCISVFN